MTKQLPPLIKLMRPRQWTKNAFVLAPLVFSLKLSDPQAVIQALSATAFFCLIASAVYIVNDILDVKADRQHPKKRTRPLAAGKVTPNQARGLFVLLVAGAAGFAACMHFNTTFLAIAALYLIQSFAYSCRLKHVALLELFIVASGYVLRLLAGCAAIDETASPWILAAAGSVALLIAAGKRRAEIAENHDPDNARRSLKNYNLTFLDSTITMLASVTVVTYLLFTISDYAVARFHSPYFVGTSVFVLYGVLRYMQLVKTAEGADDPTLLVLTDLNLRWAVIGWLMACILVIYLR